MPAEKGRFGPALGLKADLPFSSLESHRSGAKSETSSSFHSPVLDLAARLLELRALSSTGSEGCKNDGPLFIQNTSVPLGMRWPRISVSTVATRVMPVAVLEQRRASSMKASRYGILARMISSAEGVWVWVLRRASRRVVWTCW